MFFGMIVQIFDLMLFYAKNWKCSMQTLSVLQELKKQPKETCHLWSSRNRMSINIFAFPKTQKYTVSIKLNLW